MADDMFLRIGNPKDSKNILLELVDKFDEVSRYNINVHRRYIYIYIYIWWIKSCYFQ